MWNKQKDIDDSLEFIQNYFKTEQSSTLLSIDDAYNYYCKFVSSPTYKFVVSKRYFEKYIYTKLSNYIIYDNFISEDWCKNF